MTSRRLPDFVIIGAQKSGTASLSALLSSRSDVFMCRPREPMFFCRDDAAIHPHTLLSNRVLWRSFDWNHDRNRLLDGYAELFRSAGRSQLVGEGSTTYLVSKLVPERIASVMPQAKLIALLRNPIDRAYSAYFHHLKNFRVVRSFEEQLKFEPGDLLETGNYRSHLQRYLQHFPKEQLLVLPFEQFVKDTQAVFERVCGFLGLEPRPINPEARSNGAVVPRLIGVQQALNAALRLTESSFEAGPIRVLREHDPRPLALRAADKALRGLGRLNRYVGPSRYPPLRPATRELLRDYFARQNAGLSELTQLDFSAYWRDFAKL